MIEDDYTKEGLTLIIKRIETQMINVRSRKQELQIELRALEEWQIHQERARNRFISMAIEKGIELDPKDFMLEL